jgi:hypothetical protein
VSWTVDNNTTSPISGSDLRLGVEGVEIAADSAETGSETFVGPDLATTIENAFYGSTVVGSETVPFYAYGTVNAAACVTTGPTTTAGVMTSTVPPSTSPPIQTLVLTGEVVCTADGDSTVTWTMHNNTDTVLRGTDLRGVFAVAGVDIPANDTVSADETITGPAEPGSVDNEVYGFSGSGSSTQVFYASATLAPVACTASAATEQP